jgi:hypothetical protein
MPGILEIYYFIFLQEKYPTGIFQMKISYPMIIYTYNKIIINLII